MNRAFLFVLFGLITIQILSYYQQYPVSTTQTPPDALLPLSSSSRLEVVVIAVVAAATAIQPLQASLPQEEFQGVVQRNHRLPN